MVGWYGPTKLGQVDSYFRQMENHRGPLTLDGRDLGGCVPPREVTLRELRVLDMGRKLGKRLSNLVWAELVFRAQSDGGDWVLGATWMLTPALRGAVRRAYYGRSLPYADVEAYVVEGFLGRLFCLDAEQLNIPNRLYWAGLGNALKSGSEKGISVMAVPVGDSLVLHGHASTSDSDEVLQSAVRDRVLTEEEAEIIASTRLEEQSFTDVARRLRLSRLKCVRMREEAEGRLGRYLGWSKRIDG